MTEYERRYKIIVEIEKLMVLYAKEMDDELYLMSVGNGGSIENYLLTKAKFKELQKMKEKLLALDLLDF